MGNCYTGDAPRLIAFRGRAAEFSILTVVATPLFGEARHA
jgi:hypothetical protein